VGAFEEILLVRRTASIVEGERLPGALHFGGIQLAPEQFHRIQTVGGIAIEFFTTGDQVAITGLEHRQLMTAFDVK